MRLHRGAAGSHRLQPDAAGVDCRPGRRAIIVDGDNEARLLAEETLRLTNRPPYRYLSLIPLDTRVEGVTLEGVKYPLQNAALTRGDTFTVSNEPAGER